MTSPKIHSERSFGLVFAAVFAVIGIYGLYKGWVPVASVTWLVAGLLLALIAVVSPKLLAPFNRAWFRLGLLLNKIVSPVVLGIIFFGLLTPVAVLARLFGRQVLLLKPRSVSSYWVMRSPPGPASDSFKNQF